MVKCYIQAYHHRYYGPKYVWWFQGWLSSTWWLSKDPSLNCTSEELFQAIDNSTFYTRNPIYSTSDIVSPSGKVFINDRKYDTRYGTS